MLILSRVQIQNFAILKDVNLSFAKTDATPLTVIRAENASGKTTLLRALRWGFYGEDSLPGNAEEFGVHHPSWTPALNSDPMITKVIVDFATDRSSRRSKNETRRLVKYRLIRDVQTIARERVRGEAAPAFKRVQERVQLLEEVSGGAGFRTISEDPREIRRQVGTLLPWGLRDFLFLDADEATDYVGGSEQSPLPEREVLEKTTESVRHLLGLAVFEDTADRMEKVGRQFTQEAATTSTSQSSRALNEQLKDIQAQLDDSQQGLSKKRQDERELAFSLAAAEEERDRAIAKYGGQEQAIKQRDALRRERNILEEQREGLEGRLAASLLSEATLFGLMQADVLQVREKLAPLSTEGRIPASHIPFVRRILREGRCICGTELSPGTLAERQVHKTLESSEAEAADATTLGRLYDQISHEDSRAIDQRLREWSQSNDRIENQLGKVDDDIGKVDSDLEEVSRVILGVNDDTVRYLKEKCETLRNQYTKVSTEKERLEGAVERLEEEQKKLRKQLEQQLKRERVGETARRAAQLSRVIENILREAFEAVRDNQVASLSRRMNDTFQKIVASSDASGVGPEQSSDGELRGVSVIRKVGLRERRDLDGLFEITAWGPNGEKMPSTQLNGASRRVLALSFILSLTQESHTQAPFIADSLLNMMSGHVRTNTFRTAVDISNQSVFLLTRADLDHPAERTVATQFGGRFYTLSAPGTGVLKYDRDDPYSAMVCSCRFDEYCNTCEIKGDSEAYNLHPKRTKDV